MLTVKSSACARDVADPGADTHAGSNYANSATVAVGSSPLPAYKADIMKEKGSLRRCPTGRACCSAWGSYLCGSVCVIPGAGVLGTGDADRVRFWAKLSSSAAPPARAPSAQLPQGIPMAWNPASIYTVPAGLFLSGGSGSARAPQGSYRARRRLPGGRVVASHQGQEPQRRGARL